MRGPAELPLRDIHLPDPVSWWPPAPGWWLLAGLLFLVFALTWWWRRRRESQRRKPLVLAAVELARLRAQAADNGTLAVELSAWLRRVCLALYPPGEVAGLNGRHWLEFLDNAAGQPLFAAGPGQAVADVAYRPEPGIDSAELLALCERWLAAIGGRRKEGGNK